MDGRTDGRTDRRHSHDDANTRFFRNFVKTPKNKKSESAKRKEKDTKLPQYKFGAKRSFSSG
jgi:hypothetical protein